MGGLKIQTNDILYTLRGSTIGKNAIANFNGGTVASSLMAIRIKNIKEVTPLFLFYWLSSNHEYIQRDLSINGSTAPNLSAEDVGLFKCFLPPLEEQKEIIQYLDNLILWIDDILVQKDLLINEIESYKKSIIFEYVTGKKEVTNNDKNDI